MFISKFSPEIARGVCVASRKPNRGDKKVMLLPSWKLNAAPLNISLFLRFQDGNGCKRSVIQGRSPAER